MDKTNSTKAREEFFGILAKVSAGNSLLITSKTGNCMLVSEAKWNSMAETVYVMSTPKIREDIIEGLKTPLDECSETLAFSEKS